MKVPLQAHARAVLAAATFALLGAQAPAAPPENAAPPVDAAPRFKNAPAARPAAPRPPAGQVAGLPIAPWWTVFHDPALDALETPALAANQDLQQALGRIAEARQQTHVSGADYYPHAEINPDASRQRTTGNGPIQSARIVGNGFTALFGGKVPSGTSVPAAFASQLLPNTYDGFQIPLTVSYEVDVFGRIRHAYGSARASLQAAEADRRALALSLSADLATNYFALRALDSQIGVLRRNVDLRAESLRLNQERVTAGVANPLDLSRARVELENTSADLDEVQRQRAVVENTLAALSGRAASEFRLPPRLLEEVAPPAIPAGVPAQLLARRPDLAEAERRVAAANEDIGVAHANLLPRFNIEGDAGLDSADYNHVFDAESRELRVLGRVTIPIFEGGRNVAELRAARARREQALAAYRATAITAFKEVENALSDVRLQAAQFGARERAAAAADDVLVRSQKRYTEGAVNYFEVVDAQRLLLGAQLGRVQTLNARFAATIALVRALGGSWQAPVQPAPGK